MRKVGKERERQTHCCSVYEERVEFQEEASTFFGAGLLVHVGVEITELREGRSVRVYWAETI